MSDATRLPRADGAPTRKAVDQIKAALTNSTLSEGEMVALYTDDGLAGDIDGTPVTVWVRVEGLTADTDTLVAFAAPTPDTEEWAEIPIEVTYSLCGRMDDGRDGHLPVQWETLATDRVPMAADEWIDTYEDGTGGHRRRDAYRVDSEVDAL